MRLFRYMLSALFLSTFPSLSAAQDVDFTLGGQVRPRYEYRSPFLFPEGDGDSFVSMRTRANVGASLEGNVGVFIQIQDVRVWGEESSTLGDFGANNLDLHQGYVDLKTEEEGKFLGRFGRQEVNFGGQRLIGAVGWTQQGRSFDGIRLASEGKAGKIDVLVAQLRSSVAPDVDEDGEFLGGYGTLAASETQSVDGYWLYNHLDDDEDNPADTQTDQHTLGVRWVGKASDFVYRAEGSFQTGKRGGTDVSAFMLGARLGYVFANGKADVTLWYDYLSGDDDLTDEETKVFDTLFATNHKFYGFADVFLSIPLHTSGRGLQDLSIKGTWKPTGMWRFLLHFHSFHMASKGDEPDGHFGEEIDIVGVWKHSKHVDVSVGFSYIWQADGLAGVGRLNEDMSWVYVMLDVKF